jgi:hypothetical protein
MLNNGILNNDIALGIKQEYIIFLRKTGEYFYSKNFPSTTSSTTATTKQNHVVIIKNNGKTIIKRPIRYQKLKEQQRQLQKHGKSKNLFHDFIDLFFQPLLQLLSSFHFSRISSSKTSSTVTSSLSILDQTKDEFNLISTSFPSDNPAVKSISSQSKLSSSSSHTSPKKKPLIEEIDTTTNNSSLSDLKKQKKIDSSSLSLKEASSKTDSSSTKMDEYDYLLPYDALLTLAIFLKYSIFHLKYR